MLSCATDTSSKTCVCVYVCSGRAGGNERHLLIFVRYVETLTPTPIPTPIPTATATANYY